MAARAAPSPGPGPESRHSSDLYVRPGWVDANVALAQLNQDKATGDRGILWIRSIIQKQLKSLGRTLETHAGKFLFVSILAIATFSVGLKSMTFHTDIELLWAEPTMTPESSPIEMLSTHQMVVQTGIDSDVNLLNNRSLLDHLILVHQATQVSINMFDVEWRFKDFCQSPSIPNIDAHYIEQIFENIMPCSIVTPLDCFWEGSKLLGPDYTVHIPGIVGDIRWKNLNPEQLIGGMKKSIPNFDYHSLDDYLRRAGITTGYQKKPCLNPMDPECPVTAPNFNSSHPLDIGAELTSGCYGFAAKFMHWPEELIVGGVTKNKTGHIKRAKALQTVIQLMGEHELFEFLSGTYKVHHIGWNQEKASTVLNAWQKKFAQEVDRLTKAKETATSPYIFLTFSTANVNKILKEYSKTDMFKFGIVIVVVAVYGWIVQSGLAFIGAIVLASTAAAALGVCSLIGLPMNLLSTHVLPFVTVGLALRDMFLMLNSHTKKLPPPEILLRTGPSIVSSIIINSGAFLTTALLPVPALRVFALQCAMMMIFHGAALLIVFPCLLALEQRCQRSDIPCFRSDSKMKAKKNNNNNPEHGANLLTAEFICQQKKRMVSHFATRYFQSVLMKPFVKALVCTLYTILVVFFVFNGLKMKYDVRLSSFLPRHTQEYKYLQAQDNYFGFYNFYIVTTELEYPSSQTLLHEFHSSFIRVPHVLKDSNGGLSMNDFWLENFREYLEDLQVEFDRSRNLSCLNSEKWFHNATEKSVLAFKLLVQTGIVRSPVDKSQITRKKLVQDGIIDPQAFYNYLSVWNSNDQISYSSCQADLTPKPFQYFSSKGDYDLKIPRSQPLTHTQMPFYLKGLRSTRDIIKSLQQIKDISEEYNNKGLKNYPVGLLFAYFNQFLLLDRLLIAQVLLTFLASALVSCLLVKWSKLCTTLVGTIGAMLPLCLLDLSAFSSTMGAIHFIIVGRNILLLSTGFLSAVGNKERRVKMSLEINADAILKGDVGLLISILILTLSEFEFIHNQLFMFLIISVVTSVANSFVFFPLLLVIMGSKAEIEPIDHEDRISTPPPPPTSLSAPEKPKAFSKSSRRNASNKATRETSLTTITEESCNQSIVVEPQVTVEYSSPETSSSGPYTTKVTATANIKVEVVTPMYRSNKCSSSSKCYKNSKCRTKPKPVPTHQQQCKCCNKDSDSSDSTAETEPCQSS